MAVSTTQSIWRSGGGDQTRTAYCGSGLMAATFYIADASPASAGAIVKTSSASNAPDLILPAGAIVVSVGITVETGSGTFDMGYKYYNDTSTGSTSGIATGLTVALGTTSLGAVVTGGAIPALSYVTVTDNTSATGAVTGVLTYFVQDPLGGQQNV